MQQFFMDVVMVNWRRTRLSRRSMISFSMG